MAIGESLEDCQLVWDSLWRRLHYDHEVFLANASLKGANYLPQIPEVDRKAVTKEDAMFCPQCGSENSLEQKYCRRCGLELGAARISLQGGVGNALATHRRGELMFAGGGGTLVLVALTALANIFLGSGPFPVLINLLLGLVIAVPLMIAGSVHMRRAGRTLHPKNEPGQLAPVQSEETRALSSSAYSTDPLLPPTRTPDSITEETTLRLGARKPENG